MRALDAVFSSCGMPTREIKSARMMAAWAPKRRSDAHPNIKYLNLSLFTSTIARYHDFIALAPILYEETYKIVSEPFGPWISVISR